METPRISPWKYHGSPIWKSAWDHCASTGIPMGISMEVPMDPLCLHGNPHGSPKEFPMEVCSTEAPWKTPKEALCIHGDIHGTSVVLPWCVYGNSLDIPWCFPWELYGTSTEARCPHIGDFMVLARNFHGTFVEAQQCCHGNSMGTPWDFHGTRVPPWGFPWCFRGDSIEAQC